MTQFEVKRYLPIGAEVSGVDLSRALDSATRERLNAAFVEHSFLVFRNQALSPAQMVPVAEIFGGPFPQHNSKFALPDFPMVHYVSNQDFLPDGKRFIPGDDYHTDHSNDLSPPRGTILHAVRLPNAGGDTQFVDMYKAYEDLSEKTKQRIEGLRAIHVYQSSKSARKLPPLDHKPDNLPDATLQPLVVTHPESGRRALYINPIRIEGIEGMENREAFPLLDALFAHATQQRYQYRHVWALGDVVMWDNRCLLHKANGDYDMNQSRYLYRLMIKGQPLSR